MKSVFEIAGLAAGYLFIMTAIAGTTYAGAPPVPEVDPSLAVSAIAVLVGGYLVAVSKLRRK